jgi:uncharacterized protein (TIGR02466 family)
MRIDQWYPTFIGCSEYSQHNLIKEQLIEECFYLEKNVKKGGKDWVSDSTYNTLNSYNILKNKKFAELNSWVDSQVSEYLHNLKCKDKLKCVNGWFNIYKKHDYQEYHDHGEHSLSAVYFLKSNVEKSAKLFFKFTNASSNIMDLTIDNNFLITCPVIFYKASPGTLLIFKSSLSHCVEKQQEDDTRISIAYNFNRI